MAGVRHLDLTIHPPPDLAFEVDVTNSSLDRFGIYQSLGVTELWHLDGGELQFHVLGADKKYARSASSPTFARIAPADLIPFLNQVRSAADQNLVAAAFREWIRQRLAAPPA